MLRTYTCGELTLAQKGKTAILCGWVQRIRDKGQLLWIDLRDRYGITQLVLEKNITPPTLFEQARKLGREYVIRVHGKVVARNTPNKHLATGNIEIQLTNLEVLNPAKLPPFLIEDITDGSQELRMQYRYLDLRRRPLLQNLQQRHQLQKHTRTYLDQQQFIEVETPLLIKSTPEGARDFLVPTHRQPKHYYALPQSPQTLKQLLMIGGLDRYYQLVKCFRDEDLRSDRQPEFTQIDCELSFVNQEDIFTIFEGLVSHLFKKTKNIVLPPFIRMTYADAIKLYGTDKPDLRWGMPFVELTKQVKGQSFSLFDKADLIVAICVPQGAKLSRKQIDLLIHFVKQPPISVQGLVYAKYKEDNTFASSVRKWYSDAMLHTWFAIAKAKPGDLLLILAGNQSTTRQALSALRLEVAKIVKLKPSTPYATLWITDFPLLEWDKDTNRYQALHHPFTAPKQQDAYLLTNNPAKVRSQAYDMVINGIEIGGGSVRIHTKEIQAQIFELLGFSPQQAQEQFGFLMEALSYGAPPHAGIALGFDRLCMLLGGSSSIRDYIAFPKNNAGRDTMLNAPSKLSAQQYTELGIKE